MYDWESCPKQALETTGRQRPGLPSWAPKDSVLSILTKNMLFGVGGTSLEPALTGECHKCFEAPLNVRGFHSQSAQWELCVSHGFLQVS